MESESGVTGNIIHELHSWDIQRYQTGGESGVTRSIIEVLHPLDIQRDQMEGEGGVTRSIIDELHSLDMVKWKVKVVLVQVSLMNFILRISKKNK